MLMEQKLEIYKDDTLNNAVAIAHKVRKKCLDGFISQAGKVA